MFIPTLHLAHFRNYRDQTLHLTSPKLILVGDNAQGKTNLLEAVQLLATGRAPRAQRDRELVQQGADFARITAQVQRREGDVELELTLRPSGQRTFRVNGVTQTLRRDFLGILQTVFFSSWDLDLIRGAPQQRRDWLDGILMQLEPIYSELLEEYQRTLQQRNALLRQHRDHPPLNVNTQEWQLWNEQLVRTGIRLMRRRRRLIERLNPLADYWQQRISGGQEHLHIKYEARVPCPSDDPIELETIFWEQLSQRYPAELHQGVSLVGPHRDEVEFRLPMSSEVDPRSLEDESDHATTGVAARLFGSQGQQRTLVLALKLAELQLLEQVHQQPPLLLLDDVLAELDLKRQNHLLNAIGDRVQTLVTTTHLGSFDSEWLQSAQIWEVRHGTLHPGAK